MKHFTNAKFSVWQIYMRLNVYECENAIMIEIINDSLMIMLMITANELSNSMNNQWSEKEIKRLSIIETICELMFCHVNQPFQHFTNQWEVIQS